MAVIATGTDRNRDDDGSQQGRVPRIATGTDGEFPLDKPVPFDLIRKIVKFRVKEARAKPAARARRTKSDYS